MLFFGCDLLSTITKTSCLQRQFGISVSCFTTYHNLQTWSPFSHYSWKPSYLPHFQFACTQLSILTSDLIHYSKLFLTSTCPLPSSLPLSLPFSLSLSPPPLPSFLSLPLSPPSLILTSWQFSGIWLRQMISYCSVPHSIPASVPSFFLLPDHEREYEAYHCHSS